ncbi:MAG: hypothetical protein OQK43_03515 [Flavobacteriales bacterium]|nr:hypothetical protein [Flavobacteriales bacterium]
MQHLKTIFILVSIAFLASTVGCKKDTTADVFVYEKGTNKPMVGIPVNFGYTSSNGLFAGGVLEQQKNTDVNGRVTFKAEKNDESYSVKVPDGVDYFGDATSLKQGENNRVFLEASPFAYVRVHAKNVNPFDNNDRINIGGGFLYGANVDTIVIQGPFKGTGTGNFGWNVIKNNVSTDFSIQLYFIGRDTINYTIEY